MAEGAEWKRVDELLAELERCNDVQARQNMSELVSALMSIHGEVLAALLPKLAERDLSDLRRDPRIESVLLLHGLHPDDVEARVEQALEKVRPSLRSHHGDVELLGIEEGKVRLKLSGTCHGCPSSATTFKNLLETAIQELVPEIDAIEVDGMVGRAQA
jgi:Fe-S cluster biogenesis protein NfuA